MAGKERITDTALKGHRLTVTIEMPIYSAMERVCGPSRQFKDFAHCINHTVGKALGVQIRE